MFIAGAVAIVLVIGIITTQRVFLNRIHAARRTGEALYLFITGADRSVNVLIDMGYTLSNVLAYLSILGTIGSLVFSAGLHPLILIAAPTFAAAGLILAMVTVVLGRKHLEEMKILPIDMTNRFVSGLISGLVIASIGALAFAVTTAGVVAIPIAIITGVALLAGAVVGM